MKSLFDFYQRYLDMIQLSFKNEEMAIVECIDNSDNKKYILCVLKINSISHRFDIYPIAILFDKNPYMSMQPITDTVDAVLASQQDLEALHGKQLQKVKADKKLLN